MELILENNCELNSIPAKEVNQKYTWLLSAIAALGGVLFGFDTAIISGAIPYITTYFNLDEWMLGWAVSCILVGCGLGALLAGKLADLWGRKKVLFLCAILFATTGVCVAVSKELYFFVFFRIAGGIAVGAAAMVVPMYIAETVPANIRGRMVSLYQLAIVAGILLAYIVNFYLTGNGDNAWRWMFAAQVIPALLFFVALFAVPETPRWLIQNGFESEAHVVLTRTAGKRYADAALRNIRQNFKGNTTTSIRDLWQPGYKKVVLLGITIALFQQITGINAILYYAPEIFKYTGVSTNNASLQTIAIGLVMFLFTIVAIRWVDSTGRKKLLLAGSITMAVSLIIVATCFYFSFYRFYCILIFLLVYIAAFSASLGAVTWVVLSEIFPNKIRSMALSLTTLVLWIADFGASFTFPVLNRQLGTAFTLLLFAGCCIVYFVYLWHRVPETKGKTLEELETMFAN